jgi:3-hydroxyisobutyrate dehydrogenase-like beta-hydroxyacid dehydrogenase
MTLSTELINNIGTVGLIGVGTMGRCMLDRMLDAGFTAVAYDPFQGAAEYIRSRGARLADGPAEVAACSKLIIMSLPGPKQVLESLEAFLEKISPEHIIVDTSTVSPETTKEGARLAGGKGARYVDAPILGRPSAVGNWLLPAGGPADAIEFARPVLETFARAVVRVGDSGAGNAFKLLNQLMFSVINAISAEVMALTDVLGIDRKVFFDVISNSGAATVSGLFKETAGRIVDDRYDSPTFTVELLCKDAGLGLQMAKEAGVSPLISGFVQVINENAKGKGLAKKDTSSLTKVFREYFARIE